MNQIRSLSAFN